MSFSELGLSAPLLATIAKQNYHAPYPIQVAAIPAILLGQDVLGIAQTGIEASFFGLKLFAQTHW